MEPFNFRSEWFSDFEARAESRAPTSTEPFLRPFRLIVWYQLFSAYIARYVRRDLVYVFIAERAEIPHFYYHH